MRPYSDLMLFSFDFFQDSFGRLHDRGKEIPKATKLLTKLFPNKVTIHMPQVCTWVPDCNLYYFIVSLVISYYSILWKLINDCRMRRFLRLGNINWIEILKPWKWREIWITCAQWVFVALLIYGRQYCKIVYGAIYIEVLIFCSGVLIYMCLRFSLSFLSFHCSYCLFIIGFMMVLLYILMELQPLWF